MLKVGDVVDCKITEADIDRKRVSLSMRALLENQPRAEHSSRSMEDAVVYSTEDSDFEG